MIPFEKIILFLQTYLPYSDEKLMKEYLKQHIKYRTIEVSVNKNGEIIGLCRWNISEDGKNCDVLDMVIHPDYRGQSLGKSILERGLINWDKVTHLTFKRGRRGDERQHRLPIDYILKRNFF
jgi:GNAT superfamily N-acetyltransferase